MNFPPPPATVKRRAGLGFRSHSRPANVRFKVTSPAPTTQPTARIFPAFAATISCTLLLGLSVFPPSTTRLQAWPWAGYAAAGWILPIACALYRLARNRPHARFGGLLDAGLGLLAVTATASALTSPLRGAVLPHLLPVLGMCALPFALLPALQPATATRTWRISGLMIGIVLIISLLLWLEPWNGLSNPGSRNAQPFGHANITGSVAVLAATWLAAGAVRETGRLRILFVSGSVLGVMIAASSESRGAVLALAAGGTCTAAIILLQRGRFLIFAALALMLAGGAIVSNARLRELVIKGSWSEAARESNDQRTAMIVGGLRLGAERPILGWGAGAIPHVFPRVRGGLPGTADNVVQLHNTPAQLWATLGFAGLLAGGVIVAAIVRNMRSTPWTPERIALTSGLAASATVLLFDHPFATPIFAVLAAAHLAAWALIRAPGHKFKDRPSVSPAHPVTPLAPPSSSPLQPLVIGHWSLAIPAFALALLLVPALAGTLRDLAARSLFAKALDQASADNREGYANSLRRAANMAPDDPYYAHLLAAHLVTGHPFADARAASRQEAIALLERTLIANSDLEYAHYNLGWLLLDSDPDSSAAHFERSAHLAPQRGAVYLGLGLARIRLNDTDGAVRAFAAEWLLDPSSAWSPIWSQPPLDTLRPRIHTLATETLSVLHMSAPWINLDAPVTMGAPYRRLRTGYGVLMGHPEGMPPVDFNIQAKVILPADLRSRAPAFGWIRGQVLLDLLNPPAPR